MEKLSDIAAAALNIVEPLLVIALVLLLLNALLS